MTSYSLWYTYAYLQHNVVFDINTTPALCPGGGDSHALLPGLPIQPGEAGGISPSNTLCFLSNTDPRAEL